MNDKEMNQEAERLMRLTEIFITDEDREEFKKNIKTNISLHGVEPTKRLLMDMSISEFIMVFNKIQRARCLKKGKVKNDINV